MKAYLPRKGLDFRYLVAWMMGICRFKETGLGGGTQRAESIELKASISFFGVTSDPFSSVHSFVSTWCLFLSSKDNLVSTTKPQSVLRALFNCSDQYSPSTSESAERCFSILVRAVSLELLSQSFSLLLGSSTSELKELQCFMLRLVCRRLRGDISALVLFSEGSPFGDSSRASCLVSSKSFSEEESPFSWWTSIDVRAQFCCSSSSILWFNVPISSRSPWKDTRDLCLCF